MHPSNNQKTLFGKFLKMLEHAQFKGRVSEASSPSLQPIWEKSKILTDSFERWWLSNIPTI